MSASRRNPDKVTATKAQELLQIAQYLAENPHHAQAREWEQEVMSSVAMCLKKKDNSLLLQMRQQALHSDARKGLQTLMGAFEFYATRLEVFTPTGQALEARLFVVPVHILSDKPLASGELRNQRALQLLHKSFIKFYQVAKDATVIIGNYLYDPMELQVMPPTGVFHMMRSLWAAAHGETVDPVTDLGRVGTEPDASKEPEAALRYLVGIVVNDTNFGFLSTEGKSDGMHAPNADLIKQVQQSWSDNASKHIQKLLGRTASLVRVQAPQDFYQGMREGLTNYKLFCRELEVKEVLSEFAVHPKALQAVVVGHGHDMIEEVRVALVSKLDNNLVDGIVFELDAHEDVDDIAQRIASVLADIGITDVRIVPEMQDMDTCSCCGERHFTVLSADEDDVVQASTTLH